MGVLALGAVVSCVAHLGCSNQSNSGGAFGSTSSAATAAGGSTVMITPQGPYPRGQVSASRAPSSAATGPDLTIVSPARGAQIGSSTTVDVRVRATDPEGVATVSILGAPAQASGSGEWAATVRLVEGVNLIEVEATDRGGARSSSYASVTHGRFVPDHQMLPETVAVALTPAGLRRVCDVAEQQAAGLSIYSLLAQKNPIVNTAIVKVTANGLTHDPLKFSASGVAPSGLEAVVTMSTVRFDVEINVVGVTIARAGLLADKVTATVGATIDRNAPPGTIIDKRALGLRVDRVDLAFDRFSIAPQSALLAAVINPFTPIIERAVRDQLKDLLVKVASDFLGKALPGLDTPVGLELPDSLAGTKSTLDLLFQGDRAHGHPTQGLILEAGLRVTKRTPVPGSSRDVFVTGQRPTPLQLGPEPFAVGASVDAVNAVLHGLWLTGTLGHRIDGTQPYPQGKMALNVKLLYPFIPAVRDLAPDPSTPFVVEISVGAPPLARFGAQAASFVAQAGELQVRLLIDYMDGGPRLDLFTLRVAADVQAELAATAHDLTITRLDLAAVKADVIAEPTVDIADQEIVNFIQAAVPWLLTHYQSSIPSIAIPALPLGLSLTQPRVEVRPDVLIIRGGV